MFQERIVSFFYLKIFFLVIIVIVIGSLSFRIGNEVLESSFKNNSFSLLYVAKDSKIIFVDKADSSTYFLSIGDVRSFVKGKSALEASIALGIPLNGMIVEDNAPGNINDFISTKNVFRLIFSGEPPYFKNMDKYDVYKLANAIGNTTNDNRHEVKVNIFDQEDLKAKVGDGFKDSEINNTPLTIEIDNGTSVNGLGNDLALILGREGYNIISVKTSSVNSGSFIAYPNENNSLVSSLQGLTGFPIKKQSVSQSADITIFLGEDLDAMLSP